MTAAGQGGQDPRRPGLATAVVVIVYALFLGAVAAGQVPIAPSTYGAIGPSHALDGVWLAASLAIPGAIAAVGAVRRSGPLLITAGIICVAQSAIAMSGVTLPFLAPAVLLIALGARATKKSTDRRATLAGLGALVLVVASWVVGFGLTETRCWTATKDAAGDLIYADAPESATQALTDTIVAAGCDSGAHTTMGVALSIACLGAAVGLALWGTSSASGRAFEPGERPAT